MHRTFNSFQMTLKKKGSGGGGGGGGDDGGGGNLAKEEEARLQELCTPEDIAETRCGLPFLQVIGCRESRVSRGGEERVGESGTYTLPLPSISFLVSLPRPFLRLRFLPATAITVLLCPPS